MLKKSIALIGFYILSLSACAKKEAPASAPVAPPAPTMRSTATVKQLMLGAVIPASDIVFGVAATAPADAAAWAKVQANAAVIAEMAKLLTESPRKIDDSEWIAKSQAMYDTANAVAVAATEKNADKVSDTGNNLYDACDGCHMKYMPSRQGSAGNPAQ